MANIITFRNFTQKCLWDNEISGQLSDGKWENSGVDKIFWTAETKVGTPGVSFKTWKRANFNFASSELIDIVGDRMLMTAKASKVTTNEKIIGAAEYLEGITTEQGFNDIKDYREKYLKSFIKTWKVAEKIINANYSKSNLIADLKDMSRTVSLAGNTPTTSTNGNIPAKDMDRAKSIIDKAKGDEGKEIQYTTAMANATGDKSKLQFRGDAMKKLGKEKLAKIFYDKLKESKSIKVSDLIKLIESKTGKKIILENKLRTVKVEFQNGDSLTTNMAAHLTDDEINNYYKPGKTFNLGVGGKDKMVKVKKAIILENSTNHIKTNAKER